MYVCCKEIRNKQERLQREEKTKTIHFASVKFHDKGIGSLGIHITEAVLTPHFNPINGGKQLEECCNDILRSFGRITVQMEDQHRTTKGKKHYESVRKRTNT